MPSRNRRCIALVSAPLYPVLSSLYRVNVNSLYSIADYCVISVDQGQDFICRSCGVLSHRVDTEENVDIESHTAEADRSTAVVSVASDYSITDDPSAVPGNTDNEFASSTWADGMQVLDDVMCTDVKLSK